MDINKLNGLLFTLGNIDHNADITKFVFNNPEPDVMTNKRSQETYDALLRELNIRYWSCAREKTRDIYSDQKVFEEILEKWRKYAEDDVVGSLSAANEKIDYSIQMSGHPNLICNHPYFILVDYLVPCGTEDLSILDDIYFPYFSRKYEHIQDNLYLKSHGIMTQTPTQRYMAINWLKLDPTKVTSILPSVSNIPEDDFEKTPEKLILWVGADFERKGGYETLEAFNKLLEKDPSYKLVMVGIEREINSKNVEVIPFLHGDNISKLNELYKKAKLFVMPAHRENTGLVYLEAMAYKTPVIATTRGGLAEVIRRTSSGIVVPPGDPKIIYESMYKLIKDDALYKQYSDNAYSFVMKNATHDIFAKNVSDAVGKWLNKAPVPDDYIRYDV